MLLKCPSPSTWRKMCKCALNNLHKENNEIYDETNKQTNKQTSGSTKQQRPDNIQTVKK